MKKLVLTGIFVVFLSSTSWAYHHSNSCVYNYQHSYGYYNQKKPNQHCDFNCKKIKRKVFKKAKNHYKKHYRISNYKYGHNHPEHYYIKPDTFYGFFSYGFKSPQNYIKVSFRSLY